MRFCLTRGTIGGRFYNCNLFDEARRNRPNRIGFYQNGNPHECDHDDIKCRWHTGHVMFTEWTIWLLFKVIAICLPSLATFLLRGAGNVSLFFVQYVRVSDCSSYQFGWKTRIMLFKPHVNEISKFMYPNRNVGREWSGFRAILDLSTVDIWRRAVFEVWRTRCVINWVVCKWIESVSTEMFEGITIILRKR